MKTEKKSPGISVWSEKRHGLIVGVLEKDCIIWFELNVGKVAYLALCTKMPHRFRFSSIRIHMCRIRYLRNDKGRGFCSPANNQIAGVCETESSLAPLLLFGENLCRDR